MYAVHKNKCHKRCVTYELKIKHRLIFVQVYDRGKVSPQINFKYTYTHVYSIIIQIDFHFNPLNTNVQYQMYNTQRVRPSV